MNNLFILTDIEKTSISPKLVELTNKHVHQNFLAKIELRVVNAVTLSFMHLADTFSHFILMIGKTLIGIVVLPQQLWNVMTSNSSPLIREISLFSAFIHLARTVENIFFTVIAPLIYLINPSYIQNYRPYTWHALEKRIQEQKDAEIVRLNRQNQEKLNQIQELEQINHNQNEEIEQLKEQNQQGMDQIHDLEQKNLDSDEEIKKLQEDVQQVRKKGEQLEKELPQIFIQYQEKENQLVTLQTVMTQLKAQNAESQQQLQKILEQFELLSQQLEEQKNRTIQLQLEKEKISQDNKNLEIDISKIYSTSLQALNQKDERIQALEDQLQDKSQVIEDLEQQIERDRLQQQQSQHSQLIEQAEQLEELRSSLIDGIDEQGNTYNPVTLIAEEIGIPDSSNHITPIANGKVKQVWKKAREESYVYYTPLNSNTADEKEIKEEVEKAQLIRQQLKNEENYLATDLEIVKEDQKIKINDRSLFTVKTKKADGDLEKLLSDSSVNFQQRITIGRQVLKGISNLHQAGYLHGDLKPENILVYKTGNEITVRLSDFGKAILKNQPEAKMQGNPRFSPPEFNTNEKGEVYGAALIVIRLLEETVLKSDELSLLKVEKPKDQACFTKKDKETKEIKNYSRRGIEKYIVEHPSCRQFNQWVSLSYFTNYWGGVFGKSKGEEAVHRYIDELIIRLSLENHLDKTQAIDLNVLLKQMTVTQINHRPSLEKILVEFEKILKNYL